MKNKQLRNLVLMILLPVVFAGLGYFGMKVFLTGAGPKTVMPERDNASIIMDNEEASAETETIGASAEEEDTSAATDNQESGTPSVEAKPSKDADTSASGGGTDTAQPEAVETTGGESHEESPSETTSQNESPTDEGLINGGNTYSFNSLSFFSLQVGSYSAASNAENHVKTLAEESIEAYIFAGNNFKVMAGICPTREGVETIKQKIVAAVPDAFVKGMMIVPDELNYAEDAAGFDAFKEITSTYYTRLKHHVEFLAVVDTLSSDQLKVQIQADRDAIAKLSSEIDNFTGDAVFKSVLEKMMINMDRVDQKLSQTINDTNAKDSVFETFTNEILKYNELN